MGTARVPALGMPTLIEKRTLEENVRLCAELGLQFVELNMNLPEFADVAAMDRRQLRRLREEFGLDYTLHLDERMDLCDFNPLVRQGYSETLRRAFALAAELEMPILNMHWSPGVYFTLPQERVYLYERERESTERALEALRALVRGEAGNAVTLCIENTEARAPFAERDVASLLREENIALTLDVGHLATDPEQAACEAFYRAHAEKLKHMHLHDAKGKKNHLPLGEGEMDWKRELARAAAQDCRVVVEVKTERALRASVKEIQNVEWGGNNT